jgi:peptidoglycan hydrolase-like protein with peptidoglycan-binding domain
VQQALQKKGLNIGNPDGRWGKLSADALKDFQRSHDLPASGALDKATPMDLALNPTEFGFLTPGRSLVRLAIDLA